MEPVKEERHSNGREEWIQLSMVDSHIDAPIHKVSSVCKTEFDKVTEFHKAFGHEAPDKITMLNKSGIRFRNMLISEELEELQEGFDNQSIVDIADALADIVYVVLGTAAAFGIPFNEVFDEVHRSNMSKLGEDGKPIFNEYGKIMKPEGWKQPMIAEILSRYIHQSEVNNDN